MEIEKQMEITHMNILGKISVIQENLGLGDRVARVVVGAALIVPLVVAMTEVIPWMILGLPYGLAVACYLLLTGMTGWDPVYEMLNGHSCSAAEGKLCGSFTYQMDDASGRHPKNDLGYGDLMLKPGVRVVGVNYAGFWV